MNSIISDLNDRIIADLEDSYDLNCKQITCVTGGLLNKKWKILTEKGDLLVKQYSTKRFNKHQIGQIESALQRQIILEKNGVMCPFLWQRDGRVIRCLDDEIIYMVMDFRTGKTETPDSITIPQMRSLGSACALMHSEFSRLQAPVLKNLPSYGGYSQDLLWKYFDSHILNCPPDANEEYRNALLALEPILKQLSDDFFCKFPKGFAHEDFHSGNILFDVDCVSSILDFDRNCYSYIRHDIGRAILSFALEGDVMNGEKVCAFIEGYSQHSPLTLADIADALRLSWCIEVQWWIQPDFFGECDKVPRRFKNEMLWLTERWAEIDSLLGAT